MMEIMEFIQTTGAVSGLLCLTIMLLCVKKQLKQNCRK